jgi:hypothetical protein
MFGLLELEGLAAVTNSDHDIASGVRGVAKRDSVHPMAFAVLELGHGHDCRRLATHHI